MTRVLVTGGTGFVGRPATAALRARGVDVVAVGRGDVDLLDPGTIVALCDDVRPTHLLHLAWCATPGVFWTAEENVDWLAATLRLAGAFAEYGGRRFVLGSSGAVYAPDAGECDEETSELRPITLYGTCKLSAARQLAGSAGALGIDVAEARLFQLYGPGEHPDRLVPSVTRALLRGDEARCTSGEQRRDFVHISDAGDALAALVLSDLTGPVNIGTGESAAIAEVVDRIAAAVGRRDRVRLGALASAPEPALVVAGTRRVRGELGWRPAHTLETGLVETVEWWRRQEAA